MVKLIEKDLPSGAKLKFNLAPFVDGRDLYQAVVAELKDIPFNSKRELGEFYKDMALVALSSKKIEEAIWKCFKKATYNDTKISEQTFEPEEARDDYVTACLEVAKENITPFMKSLYAQYGHMLAGTKDDPT